MRRRYHNKLSQRKLFGGTNFLIVLWTLLSLLRMVSLVTTTSLEVLLKTDLYTFILPLMFLLVVNVFMGISLFIPQKSNRMWILSIILATITLLALNGFHDKASDTVDRLAAQKQVVEF